MAGMEYVEHAVGEANRAALARPALAQDFDVGKGEGGRRPAKPTFAVDLLREFGRRRCCRAPLSDHDSRCNIGDVHGGFEGKSGGEAQRDRACNRVAGAGNVKHLARLCRDMQRRLPVAEQ